MSFSQMKFHSSVASFCALRVTKLTDGCRASAAKVLPVSPLCAPVRWLHTNLVDPASSHMLVSKIKPCMSQYKLLHGETANGSLKQLSFIWWSIITWITMVILELIHAPRPNFVDGLCLLGTEPTQALPGLLVIHDNRTNRMASADDEPFKFLTYQLPTVGYWPTVAMTGNGELGFDSGEGA